MRKGKGIGRGWNSGSRPSPPKFPIWKRKDTKESQVDARLDRSCILENQAEVMEKDSSCSPDLTTKSQVDARLDRSCVLENQAEVMEKDSSCSPDLTAKSQVDACLDRSSILENQAEVMEKDSLCSPDLTTKEVPTNANFGTKNGSSSHWDIGHVSAVNPVVSEGKQHEGDKPFDICLSQADLLIKLSPSLLVKNRQKRLEMNRSLEEKKIDMLRSGMVLLKKYLSIGDQAKIVKLCRDLGVGPGGFYRPGYRDGAKLHLMMMCLGKNWDPETGKYSDNRPTDDAKPPRVPDELFCFVAKAIKDSHDVILRNTKQKVVTEILPPMTPTICIVNFYTASGKLGLHQDRDESEESLRRGLPVVSFSIGDTAEFLYGDRRDINNADKVMLESGDVLVFGGRSRHIFHGVSSIVKGSAPPSLLEESKLVPGRLNLTFREY